MTPLGDFAGPSSQPRSEALGISGDGNVIVGIGEATGTLPNHHNEFLGARWLNNGSMLSLGDLPGGGRFSRAWGASANGDVIVGESESSNSGSNEEAFRWTSGVGMEG